MRVVLITGAPSIGKTSLGAWLLDELDEACAFLDGDSLAEYSPRNLIDRSAIVHDNLMVCAANYAASGIETLIATHLFGPEDIARMQKEFRSQGHSALVLGLVAKDDALLERAFRRYPENRNCEGCISMLRETNAMVKAIPGITLVDTTNKSHDEVVSSVAVMLGAKQNQTESANL